jgi:hypothetical protein
VLGIGLEQILRKSLPEPLAFYLESEDARDWSAFDWTVSGLAFVLLVATVVSLFGLWWLKNWARLLYTASSIVAVPFLPLLGPVVSHGLASAVTDAAAMLGGMVLALIWFSDLSKDFIHRRSSSDPQVP